MINISQAIIRLDGAYGYVAAFDLSNNEPQRMYQIQVADASENLSAVVTAGVKPNILDGYCENVNCPDIAFAHKGNTVDVFLKASVYPFNSSVKVEFTFYRNAQDISDVSADYVDIPQSAKYLFRNLCWKLTYEAKGQRVPFFIENNIRKQRAFLGIGDVNNNEDINVSRRACR